MVTPATTGQGEYSMRVVTRMTGLSADTIRAWERRYEAVVPARTGGNTRRYSANDVRRLGLLKEATGRGHRIGDIATLSEKKLLELTEAEGALAAANKITSGDPAGMEEAFDRIRADYLDAIEQFDVRGASELLARSSAVFSPRDFVTKMVLPLMRETGDRWESGDLSVAQEHLVSMQVRSLFETIFRMSSPHPGAPRIIAATPPGHLHEFGALAGAMLAAMRGFDVLYLGADVPVGDLVEAARLAGADVVLLSVVLHGNGTKELVEGVEEIAATVETWVGIRPDHPAASKLTPARLFHEFDDLDIALTQLHG